MSNELDMRAARQKFAEEARERIREKAWLLWREEAKEARRLGLYSKKTFDYDIASGLMHKAGVRR